MKTFVRGEQFDFTMAFKAGARHYVIPAVGKFGRRSRNCNRRAGVHDVHYPWARIADPDVRSKGGIGTGTRR